jgi:hypothetical protein
MPEPTTYDVPKGTREAECRGCGDPIYWITTPKGSKMPVDCEPVGYFPPSDREDGRGVSHFTTCAKANEFSGRNRK